MTVGAMPREVGSKPHPYRTFCGKASQNKKDLNHLICSTVAKGLWGGKVQRHCGTYPQPAAMFEDPASVNPLPLPPATEPQSLLTPSPELWCISSGVWAVL